MPRFASLLCTLLFIGCGQPGGDAPFHATRAERQRQKDKQELDAAYTRAEAAYRERDLDAARARFLELAVADPDAWAPRMRLASIASTRHEHGEQERWLREAIALAPERIGPRYSLVSALIRQRRYDDATREFRALAPLGPADAAVELRIKGALALRAGRLEQALVSFDTLVRDFPQEASGWVGLGVVKAFAGDFRGALEALEHASKLAPRSAVPHYDLALVHYRQGNLEAAAAAGARAVTLDPYYMAARNNLAATLLAEGKREQARAELEQAVAMRPAYSPAHNNLGILLLGDGKLDEARAAFDRAIHHAPRVASFHFNLGLAYFRLGQYERAREAFARVTELDPANRDAPRNLEWLRGREAGTISGDMLPITESRHAVDEYDE